MKTITVKKIYDLLAYQMKIGNEDKEVLLSDDDECNGFHTMFNGIDSDENDIREWFKVSPCHDGQDPKDVVILF